jgi:tRNA threonylcarbamoyladenosine biosynthesis protein TsaB
MKLLALDTSTEACSVSLAVDGRRVDRYVELERGHSEQILPMVQDVLSEAGIGLRALDAIAFGRGPGGFTGVRLAASVVQGLAFGADLGVVPISTLAAVARRAWDLSPLAQRILVASDARMREVYWAEFLASAEVSLRGEEQVSVATAVRLPGLEPGVPWVAAGRGLAVWPELSERCQAAGATLHMDLLPRAAEILELARPRVASGQVLDPSEALPVYVRDRVAVPTV